MRAALQCGLGYHSGDLLNHVFQFFSLHKRMLIIQLHAAVQECQNLLLALRIIPDNGQRILVFKRAAGHELWVVAAQQLKQQWDLVGIHRNAAMLQFVACGRDRVKLHSIGHCLLHGW